MKLDKELLGHKRLDVIGWDEFFMALAFLCAKRSKDPSTQVGACIVSDDHRILSLGYNGAPNGFSDDNFPWERTGKADIETKYPYVCHAELNAILNYNGSKKDLYGSTMFVGLFPCNECTKVIVQAGIKKIIYLSDKYHDTPLNDAAKLIFDSCGVIYEEFPKELQKDFTIHLHSDAV